MYLYVTWYKKKRTGYSLTYSIYCVCEYTDWRTLSPQSRTETRDNVTFEESSSSVFRELVMLMRDADA